MPLARIRRTLTQCAGAVLSVLEEVDEGGQIISQSYHLTRNGRSIGGPLTDRQTAERMFMREMDPPSPA